MWYPFFFCGHCPIYGNRLLIGKKPKQKKPPNLLHLVRIVRLYAVTIPHRFAFRTIRYSRDTEMRYIPYFP